MSCLSEIVYETIVLTLSARDRLSTSESDDCRRQILTYKDGPRTDIIKLFIMTVDT